MKEQYAKEHALIKTDGDGDAPVPFSRQEFENFHNVYIKYNNEIKKLITKIYTELKQEMKAFKEDMDVMDRRLTQVESNQVPLPVIVDAVLAAIKAKIDVIVDAVLTAIKAKIDRFIAKVIRKIAKVIRYVLAFGLAAICVPIFVIVVAVVWWYVAYFGPGKYW